MSAKPTGGPAFPVDQSLANAWTCFENARKPLSEEDYVALIEQLKTGMSVRDVFAKEAMKSIIAQVDAHDCREWSSVAWISYQIADAMIAERCK